MPPAISRTHFGLVALALPLVGSIACGDDDVATTVVKGSETTTDGSGDGSETASDETASNEPERTDPVYFKASHPGPGDLFGVAIARSADGTVLAVAANREGSGATGIDGDADDDSQTDAGAVYVFTDDGDGWRQTAYLKAFNTGSGDGFGTSLALSADGSTLAVGAPFEASAATGIDGDGLDDSAPEAGAVYVFVRQGDTWVQQAYVKAENADEGDRFGTSLALSADGNTLAIGVEGEDSAATGIDGNADDESAFEAGAVYVFSRDGSAWRRAAYLKASNTDSGDRFGIAVALTGDGDTLVVGAHGEDSIAAEVDGDQEDDSASGAGAAYVFVYDGAWHQQAYLKGVRSHAEAAFGCAVSISDDGDTIAVGAAGDASAASGLDSDPNDGSRPYAGAAHVFRREGSTWRYEAYLKASHPDAGDEFGHHLHLSASGDVLAVGAALEASAGAGFDADPSDDSASASGAVYVFTHDGEAWAQRAFVKAPHPDPGDRFGWSVALSADGAQLAVGASREASGAAGIDGDAEDDSAPQAGAVFLFGDVLHGR